MIIVVRLAVEVVGDSSLDRFDKTDSGMNINAYILWDLIEYM